METTSAADRFGAATFAPFAVAESLPRREPRKKETEGGREAPGHAHTMADNRPTPVLVADDDPDTLAMLERHLATSGYEVLTASNGASALRVMLDEGPRIAVIDWMMPEMTGVEFCRAIRGLDAVSFAYIIIVTAYQTDEPRIVEAFEAGADDFLAKPIRKRELTARIRAGERIVTLQRALERRNREVYRFNAQLAVTNQKIADANDQLTVTATTDELTGLINRRAGMERLAEFWELATRKWQPLSCILFDVDHFKRFNDTHGHDVGDQVLIGLARIAKETMRQSEVVCRIGGEEFLMICPSTSADQAVVGAERLRRAIESRPIIVSGLTLHATVSLGVAERDPDMRTADDILRAADKAMYAAKRDGRNAVARAGSYVEGTDVSDARPQAAPAQRAVEESEPPTDVDSPCVLVVDDDEDTRTMSRRALERAGFAVRAAFDAAAAVAMASSNPPDVILMDLTTPVMDGLKCTRALKSDSKTEQIPIIIASARSDTTDIVTGLDAGADEYITKPVHPLELTTRVRSMIRLRRELRENKEIRGEQSRVLEHVSGFACEIAADASLDHVLDQTVMSAATLTGARRVTILLPDERRHRLSIVASIGGYHGENIPIEGTALGTVFSGSVPIAVESAADARRYADGVGADLLATVPSYAIPLRAPDGNVGVLCMTGRSVGGALTSFHTECLHLISNIAGSALHERMTRRSRDQARHSIVVALAKLAEHRDTDTGRHVERVTRFCLLLAARLSDTERYRGVITDAFLEDLERAAPLHDIGKVAIPDRILLKPGALTKDEFAVMQTHAAIGARTIRSLLERTPDVTFLVMAEEIAHCHHEWFDGGGYPQRLAGSAIPLSARIAAVADVYDAVTTKRVYKDAMSHATAAKIITGSSGRQFDPDVIAAFRAAESEIEKLAVQLADDPHKPPFEAPKSTKPREWIAASSENA